MGIGWGPAYHKGVQNFWGVPWNHPLRSRVLGPVFSECLGSEDAKNRNLGPKTASGLKAEAKSAGGVLLPDSAKQEINQAMGFSRW